MYGDIFDMNINTLQVVIGDKKIRTYVNGALKGNISYSANLNNNVSAPLYVGQRYSRDSDSRFNGEIYSVRVYNKTLSESELSVNYTWDKINFGN